jgi:spore coat protein U-like protein
MTSGLNLLNYSIYTNASHTTVWGDGTSGSSVVSGSGILGVTSHTAYGQIPASQTADAGVYADVVTVNLNY